MTSPLDSGPDPDAPSERRGLESYPEFFAYPIDPNVHETTVIPRFRTQGPPPPAYQQPYSVADSGDAEGMRDPAGAGSVYPETYIKDKPSAFTRPKSKASAWPEPPLPRRSPVADAAVPADRGPSPLARASASEPVPPARTPATNLSAPTAQETPWGTGPSASGDSEPALPTRMPNRTPRPDAEVPPARTPSPRAAHATPPSARSRPESSTKASSRSLASGGGGRRRAKRRAALSLWPFQAFNRPAAAPASPYIRSRSTRATVWRKLRADRAAVFGGWTIVVLIVLAVFAPLVTGVFGSGPNKLHPELTDATFGPHGSWGGISWSHPLGVDQRMGRDIMARLLFGARVSLLIAVGATLLSVGLGTVLGLLSGYLGGRVDLVLMRLADLFLAFPLMLFALGLTGALSDQAFGLSGNGLRIAVMVFVMGFFNWPYIARIVRAEVLSLREREFVDAARAMGASTRWIIGRELLPNLLAPILVYTTLLIPANIIFEAGLSALGIGLNPPTASWGQMLTDAVATVYTDPEYLIVPGMAVFITVLAFNLFGDGLRNATDPTAQ